MKKENMRRWIFTAAALICIALLNTFFISDLKNSQVNIINVALIFFFGVAGMYLMLGLGGVLSMCSITMLGLGAFVCGFLNTKMGVPILPAMLAGALASGLLSLLLGLLLLKLQGPAFVFGTIGVTYIGQSVFQNFAAFTGGPNGTSGIADVSLFGHTLATFKDWFPVLAVLVVLLILLLNRIKQTSFGRGLMAVRDDATAAYSLGINVYRTKVIVFVLAGLLAGFGGSLYAVHNGTISASLFTFNTQLKFIIMLMLGGVMSPIGSLFGTVLVNYLPEIARFANSYLNMLYGAIIVLLMIFMPMGLAGIVKEAGTHLRVRLNKRKAAGNKEKEVSENVLP